MISGGFRGEWFGGGDYFEERADVQSGCEPFFWKRRDVVE